jgi:hypothetical protein
MWIRSARQGAYQLIQISDYPRTWLRRVSSGSLVIRTSSPQTERNRLDDCAKCTAGLNLGNLVIPLSLLGLGRLDQDSLETHPLSGLLNPLPDPGHDNGQVGS